ncbi:unnamed protein product [Ectocarpus sp. CCAP 1310/34]|nr:unnamed protein product [Ectocarpus sp. CCAP 1310/34]
MANLPPVLSECEPIESWGADQPRQEIVWSWNRFVAMGPRGGAWTHQQRRLLQNPAAYYANQSVRDKDDMQAPDMHAHAANCMRTFAAPGIILFLTQSCGFSMPHGLDAGELGKVSENDGE